MSGAVRIESLRIVRPPGGPFVDNGTGAIGAVRFGLDPSAAHSSATKVEKQQTDRSQALVLKNTEEIEVQVHHGLYTQWKGD